jgi:hypothetical protein
MTRFLATFTWQIHTLLCPLKVKVVYYVCIRHAGVANELIREEAGERRSGGGDHKTHLGFHSPRWCRL